MHRFKQRGFLLKFDRHSFSQLYVHCQLYSTLPLCSICSNGLITFYLLLFCKAGASPAPSPTALPTSACKPLPRHSSPVLCLGTVLPRAEQGDVATAEPHGCVDGAQGTGIRGKSCWAASWLSGLHERRFYTSPASFSLAPITFLEVCSLKSCCRGQMLVLFSFKSK